MGMGGETPTTAGDAAVGHGMVGCPEGSRYRVVLSATATRHIVPPSVRIISDKQGDRMVEDSRCGAA